MSRPPASVVPIFATPFGVLPLPQAESLNAALAPLLSARAAADVGAARSPLFYRSRDDLLEWPQEPVRTACAEVLRAVYGVVTAVNDFTPAQLQAFTLQARGWVTLVRPDGCVPAAHYPLTAWCAIYCVAAPEHSPERRDSGVLRLYESRLGTMFSDASNSLMRIPYTTGHYTWRPVPGQVAVFPASLTHEIALIRGRGELILMTLRVRFVAPGQQGQPAW